MQKFSRAMSTIMNSPPAKRVKPNQTIKKKLRKYKSAKVDPTSSEGVLRRNIADIWPDASRNDMNAFVNRNRDEDWPLHTRLENLEIIGLAANGTGLAKDAKSDRVILVPFTLPGDVVNVQVYRTEEFYLEAEIREVVKPSEQRDDSLVKCQYFGKCGGCQYQNTSYEHQLEIKRSVVVNAYRFFAPNVKLPEIGSTMPSPDQYWYRTKLTPHFDVPKRGLSSPDFPIGFGQKGRKELLDIEECVIGTPTVNRGIKEERQRAKDNYANFKRGVTFLIREAQNEELVLDPRQVMREQVGNYVFEYKAGEFFQNNNSILPSVTSYVAEALKVPSGDGDELVSPQFLVDTYCGCGLFAITCSKNAERVVGVEISAQNVEFARTNAKLNEIDNAEFVVGEAEKIFAKVRDIDPRKTAVVCDPPRKGCDDVFLNQLLAFKPAKIVYVSCNVHSQARDLEYFLGKAEGTYEVESLRGFDFFPQTYHVEGVAVLRRTD